MFLIRRDILLTRILYVYFTVLAPMIRSNTIPKCLSALTIIPVDFGHACIEKTWPLTGWMGGARPCTHTGVAVIWVPR